MNDFQDIGILHMKEFPTQNKCQSECGACRMHLDNAMVEIKVILLDSER